jgi:hypothetical protein
MCRTCQIVSYTIESYRSPMRRPLPLPSPAGNVAGLLISLLIRRLFPITRSSLSSNAGLVAARPPCGANLLASCARLLGFCSSASSGSTLVDWIQLRYYRTRGTRQGSSWLASLKERIDKAWTIFAVVFYLAIGSPTRREEQTLL